MRTTAAAAAAFVLAALTTVADAAPCRIGTNMPASDGTPPNSIDPNQARMVCESYPVTYRTGPGGRETVTVNQWNFSLRDKDGNRVDNDGKRLAR